MNETWPSNVCLRSAGSVCNWESGRKEVFSTLRLSMETPLSSWASSSICKLLYIKNEHFHLIYVFKLQTTSTISNGASQLWVEIFLRKISYFLHAELREELFTTSITSAPWDNCPTKLMQAHQEPWAGNCRQSSPCTNPQKLNWEHPECRTKLTLPTLPAHPPKLICLMYKIVARLYLSRSMLSQLCFPVLLQLMSLCGTSIYSGYTLQWGLQGHSTTGLKLKNKADTHEGVEQKIKPPFLLSRGCIT